MSGGVDSSVCAQLLKEQGYRVIGLFMKNWEEAGDDGVCTAAADFQDVARVCETIDIPYYSVNFAKEYWDNVFAACLEDYKAGHTPNPDILCNREIKFKAFFRRAMELGADYLATGHYCQNVMQSGQRRLVKGVDPGKDQTYFLNAIDWHVLDRVLFPVGGLLKREVRALAARYGLATHDKKDSTGICFIGERDIPEFLSRYLQADEGKFKTLAGVDVGRHRGSIYYTLGQRKGLGLGGMGEPWFVVGKNVKENIVYVERGERHPMLYCDELTATDVNWISANAPREDNFRCKAKVRYRQDDQDCTVTLIGHDKIRVVFDTPQRAVAPRQSIVLYSEDVCLGGGSIDEPGASYYQRRLQLPEIVAR